MPRCELRTCIIIIIIIMHRAVKTAFHTRTKCPLNEQHFLYDGIV